MANGMVPQEKGRDGPYREYVIPAGYRMASARRSLLKSAIFALACWRVSKSLLTFTIGIGASKMQRQRVLPVRGAVLRPNATPTIGSEGV
jgi:hypothetical protein